MTILVCPKCSHQRQPGESHIHPGVCPACGIAYQKYLDRQRGVIIDLPPPVHETIDPLALRLKRQLIQTPSKVDRLTLGGRALAWTLCALWGVWFTVHGINWEIIGGAFLHNAILPFHEFGHVLFRPFGNFMAILGGSLFQVLMPFGLGIAFIVKQRDPFGASVMLWWCGQSLVDLSPYIADAIERSLPLVGGAGEESHDWGNLLTAMNLLDHTASIARLCFMAGVVTMLMALIWGAALLRLQWKRLDR